VSAWARFPFALVLAMLSAAAPTFAQADHRDEVIQKLLARVDALEKEVAELRQAQSPPSPAPQSASQQAVAPAVPAVKSTNQTASLQPDHFSRFTFHGYTDVGFLRNQDGASTKRFALGEVDLFAIERLSPRLTALLETVLETDNQTEVAQVPVNIERLLLQYRGNDYFNLDIGSYRTAIGFYSLAFLRGSWLQTALSRPLIFNFEDDGGILPLHNVGLSANGILPSGGLGLHYVAEVGASRNYGQNIGANFPSADNRAVNMAIFARPRRFPGLDVGFSSYHDRYSPFLGFLLDRSVWTAHVVYQGHRIELLNEGALATGRISANSYSRIPAFYSQLAYRVKAAWTPYVRYEYANANGRQDNGASHQYTPWRTVWLGGVRYDVREFAALKFELGRETSWLEQPWIRAALQLAFTF
jgi:hypothetical protein